MYVVYIWMVITFMHLLRLHSVTVISHCTTLTIALTVTVCQRLYKGVFCVWLSIFTDYVP